MARPPLPARCSTSIAVIKSWECREGERDEARGGGGERCSLAEKAAIAPLWGVRLKTHPYEPFLLLKPFPAGLKVPRDEGNPPNCDSFETREAGCAWFRLAPERFGSGEVLGLRQNAADEKAVP